MHDNPVKRNGGHESVTRQFAMLQALAESKSRFNFTDDQIAAVLAASVADE